MAEKQQLIDIEPFFLREDLTAGVLAEVHARWSAVPGMGGVVSFVGQVRGDEKAAGPGEAGRVTAIDFTAHEEMAVAAVRELVDEVVAELPEGPAGLFMRHRLGRVAVGEYPVIIVVGTGHREEAYAASRRLIDGLKERAPIFGKEILDSGGHSWKEA